MPHYCCVTNCLNRSDRDDVRFYRIPAVLKFVHKPELNMLSSLRQEKWLSAIKQKYFTKDNIKNARVCSKHFIQGKPATLTDQENQDWIPSVDMGYEDSDTCSTSDIGQSEIKRTKIINIASTAAVEEPPAEEPLVEEQSLEESAVMPSTSKKTQTKITMEKLSDVFLSLTTVQDVQEKLITLALSCKGLENDDAKTRYYTGLSTYKVLKVVLNFIVPFLNIHKNTVLPPNEQVLLTLVKLRLNLDYKDLGYRFGISAYSASTYFKNSIHVMCLRLKNFVFWPDREVLKKTMPSCFKESFQDKTTVIIDCFEIRTQTSSNLLTSAQSWSNYKHSQTVKYLIGITPQGSICFISEGWGGRVSDKFLTENSTFLNNLAPGDVILADRGFLVKEFVELFHATVKVPAFTKGKSQLHPTEIENTRAIAHVRIHVERVIGLIRRKFRITHDILTIQLLSTGGSEPIVDEIVFVCCALINICPPIVPL